MKKRILLIFCLTFFACEKGSYKNSVVKQSINRETKLEQNLKSQITDLNNLLKKIYSNNERLSYQFMGKMDGTVTTFITGKDLVIPILYENVGNELVLSIAILINLETQSKQIFIDNLLLDYAQFKNLISKATKWIYKTDNFSSKFLLEKSLSEDIEITFPQNKERKKFESFMVFDGERNLRDLVLREADSKETQTVISFKRNKVIYLNDKIKDEFIQGAIHENYDFMMEEMNTLEKAYSDLDELLKAN
ncbi:MAG: hypothetical protein ACRC1R_09620 [Cetobacterium sp.]|uniref:hypothetical protein n=1 Tax=Cetobacterium sp. TaxID=2071632 RepID=UPI0025C667F3|nr:hypothetical protein [Cetobacterium sp.]